MNCFNKDISAEGFLVSAVLENCVKYEDRDLLVYEDEKEEPQKVNGLQLKRNIEKYTKRFSAELEPKSRALIVLPQGLEYIYSLMGCWYSNITAIPTPVSEKVIKQEDISKLCIYVEDSDAKSIITNHIMGKMLQQSSKLKEMTYIYIDDIPNLNSDSLSVQTPQSEDLALLMYTSGSTSKPKGVMLTHQDIMNQAKALQWRIDQNTRMITWMPQFHAFGLYNNILVPLLHGALSVIMSPSLFIKDPLLYFKLIQKYKATHTALPNFAFEYCVENVKTNSLSSDTLSSLKALISAGEPIRRESYEEFEQKFEPYGLKKDIFCPLLGLTELCPVCSIKVEEKPRYLLLDYNELEKGFVKIAAEGSNGKSITSCGSVEKPEEICIVDVETMQPCSENQIGEIWIKSICKGSGYLNNEEATKETFYATLDGNRDKFYFRTGDNGFLRDNYLYVVGRKKEVIISNGKKYHQVDLEWTIKNSNVDLSLPLSVFSCEIDNSEKVIVIQEVEDNYTIEDCKTAVKSILQCISKTYSLEIYEIELVKKNQIPKTGSGKISKKACTERYLSNKFDVVYQYKREKDSNFVKQKNKRKEPSIMKILKQDIFKKVLKYDEIEEINLLSELNMSSIDIIKVAKEISDVFSIHFESYMLYQFSTFTKLEQYIKSLKESTGTDVIDDEEKKEDSEDDFGKEQDIAIIGLSCNYPGGSDTPEKFWNTIFMGRDCIEEVSEARPCIIDDYYVHNNSDESRPKWGYFIDDVDKFDASFFGISNIEAESMDPQQRKALEMTWNVIEDGGYNPQNLAGEKVGVYLGVHNNDYSELLMNVEGSTDMYGGYIDSGVHLGMISNRVSRMFDFHGPSETVNTACSSSLVAINNAVKGIRRGECKMAIAGGINLILSSRVYVACEKAGMLSKDGHCKTFDESADGFARAEGYGAVFLKKLSDAIKDNDSIYGVIKATEINHDGRSTSLRAPNMTSQKDLIKSIYSKSGISMDTIGYLETHGTGTSLGDPIEIGALKDAYKEMCGDVCEERCGLGSVKTIIGHAESASGVAGLIKVLMAMKHKKMAALTHFNKLNPYINLEDSPFYIIKNNQSWKKIHDSLGNEIPRRAGISSFGFGGTNAHIIVEEYEESISEKARIEDGEDAIILLSAKTKESLTMEVQQLLDYLQEAKETINLYNLSYTLQSVRDSMGERVAFFADSIEKLCAQLTMYLNHDKSQLKEWIASEEVRKTNFENLEDNEDIDELIEICTKRKKYKLLARLWVNGKKIDWSFLFRNKQVKRLHLPTYPFDNKSFWLQGEMVSRDFGYEYIDNYNEDEYIEELQEEQTYETYIDVADTTDIRELETNHLKQMFSQVSKMPYDSIETDVDLGEYGIDSLLIKTLCDELKKDLPKIDVTVFFQCRTIESLVEYFMANYKDDVEKLFEGKGNIENKEVPKTATVKTIEKKQNTHNRTKKQRKRKLGGAGIAREDIAIIGISGKYPQADNVEELWDNLKNGKDCVEEIPSDRWDCNSLFDSDKTVQGKINSKWGGFVRDVDTFDPLFFNISPHEAEMMDPQERQFLQCAYQTIEDAGYTRESLKKYKKSGSVGNVGVFVGVTFSDYHLYGISEQDAGNMIALSGSNASIANRVSYCFDFNGPSMVVDTMCSSSLSALHLACNSIYMNECKMAIAGGANLLLHPNKYLYLSQYNFLSTKGKCDSFGDSGNGYVPGEGIGAVMLKRLSDAEADGDHIYGVIKATAVNHGGKTNGFYVPDPDAQANVIGTAIKLSGVNPEEITYIEAHGTGTVLGDPIEISGLTKAFRKYTEKKGYCAVGSIKSNVGHLEAAAGIASLTKVLLQMKYRKLVPVVNSGTLNPNINFEQTPFVVQTKFEEWGECNDNDGKDENHLLTAGISCFGAGGANAHVIVQEYRNDEERTEKLNNTVKKPEMIILSSKNKNELKEKCAMLIARIRRDNLGQESLHNIAYTLQVGRAAMNERIAFVVVSIEELISKLEKYVAGDVSIEGFFQKNGNMQNKLLNFLRSDDDFHNTVSTWFAKKKYSMLLRLWVCGLDFDWESLYKGQKVKKISLNTYNFAKDRYWAFPKREAGKCLQAIDKSSENNVLDVRVEGKIVDESLKEAALLVPKWMTIQLEEGLEKNAFESKHVILVDFPKTNIQLSLPDVEVHVLESRQKHSGKRFEDLAADLLGIIKRLIAEKKETLIQCVILRNMNSVSVRGLEGMLKTASIECAQLAYQLIEVEAPYEETDLVESLRKISSTLTNKAIRLDGQSISVRSLQPVKESETETKVVRIPWKEHGVYVITGGIGKLGILFAKEILTKVKSSHVILIGRKALSENKQTKLEELRTISHNVEYLTADVTDKESLEACMKQIVSQHGSIHGILHTAGVIEDRLLLNKTEEELRYVFAPKVKGVVNLDQVTSNISLDFIVNFSSGAAEMGSMGQADYAAANAFMDSYAEFRNQRVKEGKCCGKTLSINWPLWKDGGMTVDESIEKALFEGRGMASMDMQTGIQFLYNALSVDSSQVMVVVGNVEKILEGINGCDEQEEQEMDNSDVKVEEVVFKIKELLSATLKLKITQIEDEEQLDTYGVDSVQLTILSNELSKHFKKLSATTLFEYNTVLDLAVYLTNKFKAECATWLGITKKVNTVKPIKTISVLTNPVKEDDSKKEFAVEVGLEEEKKSEDIAEASEQEIAIIGASARFPEADNLKEYWSNLVQGKDCISEIPKERWGLENFYCPDKERAVEEKKSFSKWGGFLRGFAEFDPLFFNISPVDAGKMDPQERVFMEECWKAMEDSGYISDKLDKNLREETGVYGAITKTGYELWNKETMQSNRTSFASLVNRFSYFMDFQGPSIAFDTMCSSSLVAIHEACKDLKNHEIRMAVVGGVNLYLHPDNYIELCKAGLISDSSISSVFAKNGAGFIPSEGVGAVVLKRLSDAQKDHDNILAVIKGSAVCHSGRTSGYGVPNPAKQSVVMEKAIMNAGISKESIRHIELAANGASLVDQIEMSAVEKVFGSLGTNKGRKTEDYTMGNVKTLIGHGESVSGMAQLMKCILMLQNEVMIKTSMPTDLNDEIDFQSIPFQFAEYNRDWKDTEIKGSKMPKRLLINSFGSGGVYSSLVLEAYNEVKPDFPAKNSGKERIFVFSAKTKKALENYLNSWKMYLEQNAAVDLDRIAYILQMNKKHMKRRFACVAKTKDELIERITEELNGIDSKNKKQERELSELARRWMEGENIQWGNLYPDYNPKQIPFLPVYTFDNRVFWVRSDVEDKQENDDFIPLLPEKNIVEQSVKQLPCKESEQNNGVSEPVKEETVAKDTEELSEILQKVKKIVIEILYLDENDEFDEMDTFREMGMDSLFMVKFISRINEVFGIDLDIIALFEYSSTKTLAEYIQKKK